MNGSFWSRFLRSNAWCNACKKGIYETILTGADPEITAMACELYVTKLHGNHWS